MPNDVDRAGVGVDANGFVRCRVCGCTEVNACFPACGWDEDNLCSSCAGAADELANWMARAVKPNVAALKREASARLEEAR